MLVLQGLGMPRRRRVRYEQCGVVDEETGPHHQEDPPAPTSDSAETSVSKTLETQLQGSDQGFSAWRSWWSPGRQRPQMGDDPALIAVWMHFCGIPTSLRCPAVSVAQSRVVRGVRLGPVAPPDAMFTTTGSRGLYMAPLSKGLLLVLNGLTVMLTLLPHYQELFAYNIQAVVQQHQVWRLLCGRLVCVDLKDSFCSSLLIYNFRIFERRFGTRKFASFLFGTWCLSALTDFLLVQAFQFLFDYEVEELSTGLLAPVFSLFVPFYLSIPKMPVTQVLGHISITNKTLIYIVGLQLLTSSPFMWLLALSGLISGGLYYSNILQLQNILFVPAWMSRIGRYILEPVFSTSQPISETPPGMGATLDIQRQQRMDMLDQQLLLAQYNEARRSVTQQPQGGLLQWTRLFPSLRHRGQNRPPMQPQPQAQTQPSTQQPQLDNLPVAEEQVALLVEMGFSRTDALEALRASNNDINMATNFLLQH